MRKHVLRWRGGLVVASLFRWSGREKKLERWEGVRSCRPSEAMGRSVVFVVGQWEPLRGFGQEREGAGKE